jgi:hypothetical protein
MEFVDGCRPHLHARTGFGRAWCSALDRLMLGACGTAPAAPDSGPRREALRLSSRHQRPARPWRRLLLAGAEALPPFDLEGTGAPGGRGALGVASKSFLCRPVAAARIRLAGRLLPAAGTGLGNCWRGGPGLPVVVAGGPDALRACGAARPACRVRGPSVGPAAVSRPSAAANFRIAAPAMGGVGRWDRGAGRTARAGARRFRMRSTFWPLVSTGHSRVSVASWARVPNGPAGCRASSGSSRATTARAMRSGCGSWRGSPAYDNRRRDRQRAGGPTPRWAHRLERERFWFRAAAA